MTKILVIEDNPIVLDTLSRVLQTGGYEVVVAKDGVDGLAAFRLEQPDLVVSDMIMPGQEGTETIRYILAEEPDAKIVAISGGGRIGNIDFLDLAKKMGATAVLAKPFDPDDLLAIVANCLKTG